MPNGGISAKQSTMFVPAETMVKRSTSRVWPRPPRVDVDGPSRIAIVFATTRIWSAPGLPGAEREREREHRVEYEQVGERQRQERHPAGDGHVRRADPVVVLLPAESGGHGEVDERHRSRADEEQPREVHRRGVVADD